MKLKHYEQGEGKSLEALKRLSSLIREHNIPVEENILVNLGGSLDYHTVWKYGKEDMRNIVELLLETNKYIDENLYKKLINANNACGLTAVQLDGIISKCMESIRWSDDESLNLSRL